MDSCKKKEFVQEIYNQLLVDLKERISLFYGEGFEPLQSGEEWGAEELEEHLLKDAKIKLDQYEFLKKQKKEFWEELQGRKHTIVAEEVSEVETSSDSDEFPQFKIEFLDGINIPKSVRSHFNVKKIVSPLLKVEQSWEEYAEEAIQIALYQYSSTASAISSLKEIRDNYNRAVQSIKERAADFDIE